MSQISAALVNQLRQRTSRPMMECKSALQEANGDLQKAEEILRKKGGVAKADRVTAEGRIAAFIDPVQQVGALIEVLCESAPVAKSDLFIALANDLAKQVALYQPGSPEELLVQPFLGDVSKTVKDRIADVIGVIREAMRPNRMVRLTGQLGSYCHHDGALGVLLQVEGPPAEPQLLREISMHIAASRPIAATPEEVPAEVVAKEKEIAQAQIAADPRNKSKPPNILEMIAKGKLKTFFAENVLVQQPFVKDTTKTVGDLLRAAGLKVVRFVRYKAGEATA
jgi:elongation factor Ts